MSVRAADSRTVVGCATGLFEASGINLQQCRQPHIDVLQRLSLELRRGPGVV
jgi:hypothetical protein